jgi:hypothetical protein
MLSRKPCQIVNVSGTDVYMYQYRLPTKSFVVMVVEGNQTPNDAVTTCRVAYRCFKRKLSSKVDRPVILVKNGTNITRVLSTGLSIKMDSSIDLDTHVERVLFKCMSEVVTEHHSKNDNVYQMIG